jgi:hypothetical protein
MGIQKRLQLASPLAPKNIEIIFEGKATCRLHRKSPQEYNEKSPRTGFLASFFDDDMSPIIRIIIIF